MSLIRWGREECRGRACPCPCPSSCRRILRDRKDAGRDKPCPYNPCAQLVSPSPREPAVALLRSCLLVVPYPQVVKASRCSSSNVSHHTFRYGSRRFTRNVGAGLVPARVLPITRDPRTGRRAGTSPAPTIPCAQLVSALTARDGSGFAATMSPFRPVFHVMINSDFALVIPT
jgi:hypothetical protein